MLTAFKSIRPPFPNWGPCPLTFRSSTDRFSHLKMWYPGGRVRVGYEHREPITWFQGRATHAPPADSDTGLNVRELSGNEC